MTRRRRKGGPHITMVIAMLLGSAAVHLLLWPLGNRILASAWEASSNPVPVAGGLMEVSLLEQEDDDDGPVAPKLERDGTLIDQQSPEREERPEDTEFLSEFDRSVAKEERARPKPSRDDEQREATKASPKRAPRDSSPPSKASDSQRADAKPARGAPETEEVDHGDEGTLSDPREGDDDARDEGEAGPKNPNKTLKPGVSGLHGSPETLRKLFGGRSSHDDLHEVPPGDQTLVNSKRWKYASFFNRVRNAIAQHWDPVTIRRARDPDGSRWGSQTRTTRLMIRLDTKGTLLKVTVDRSCGVQELDAEAIRAVRSAHPFNNPPRGLIDPETGYIQFAFGFILEFDGSPRIFRIKR